MFSESLPLYCLVRTNFRADLISCIGHRFISRELIFAQGSKTNFPAYIFSLTAIFSNLNSPKYFKEIGFDRSLINILRLFKEKALDVAYLYCIKEIKLKTIYFILHLDMFVHLLEHWIFFVILTLTKVQKSKFIGNCLTFISMSIPPFDLLERFLVSC